MKRLLLDQGLPRSAADHLNHRGWNAVHVATIGMSRASDAEILAHARADHRICITLDAAALADLIASIWPDIESPLAHGAMVTVTDRTIRTRLLAGPAPP